MVEKPNPYKNQNAAAVISAVEDTLREYGLVTKKQVDDKRAARAAVEDE